MIERIVIENFKSLRSVDLSLGRVNLFVGTNASGKSNFLEALRVLEGIGNGFTIDEILNGKPRSTTSEVWRGIRGGSKYACFVGPDDTDEVKITVFGTFEEALSFKWEYKIIFSSKKKLIIDEIVHIENGPSFSSDNYFEASDDRSSSFLPIIFLAIKSIAANESVLHEILQDFSKNDPLIAYPFLLSRSFSNAQYIDLKPETLRAYSKPDSVRRMGNHGDNFAALIWMICQDEKLKNAYLAWLRQLRPEEVDDVGTLTGAVGEPMFMLRENGKEYPAPVLSDGTLRFAALTAAFFQPDMPGIMTIEEIENGIHASRVQLLLELFRTQAEATKTQIFATTHSPVILDWLQEEDYKTTFLCTRSESTGETKIRSLADVPQFMDVIKKTPASELFSEGWLEAAS